jgi:hypothetical protein
MRVKPDEAVQSTAAGKAARSKAREEKERTRIKENR